MSVINTMLKDLESRGASGDKSDNTILGGLSANKSVVSEEKISGNVYIISLLSIVSILAIIAAIYYISPYKMVSVATQKDENLVASNAELLKNEMQAKSRPVLIEQDKAAVEKTDIPESVSRPVVAKPLVAKVVASKTVEKNKASIVRQEIAPHVKKMQTALVNKNTIEHNSHTEKSVTEEPPLKIKPAVIEPVVKAQPAAKESPQVVTKKQRDFTPDEKSIQAYTVATTLYNQGDRQQAKASLQEAIAYSSANLNAYSLLAVIYLEDSRADLASEVIEKGLLKHQDDQALIRLYLQSLVQQAKYKEAIAVMEKRLRLTLPEDLGYLAGLYQKQNDHLSAVKFYSRALQLKPSNSLWWMGQGISLEVMEKYEEALQSYQQSISTGQLSGKLAQYAISRINTIKQLHADIVS